MTTQSATSNEPPETVLDPLNEVGVAKRYDVDLGYLVHHINAIQMSGGGVHRTALTDFLTKGYEVVPALDVEAAEHLVNVLKQSPKDNITATCLGQAGLRSLLGMIFQGELDQRLRGTFLSNYGVIFATLVAVKPGFEDWSSFWHCDAGPECHAKVIVYLNSTTEHDAATETIDSNTTRLFKKVGYPFGPLVNRQSDLDHIADKFGITYETEVVRPEAGHAILIHPSQVLHKGVSPSHGVRYTLNLGIIPSVPDWSTFYDTSFQMLESNASGAFPDLS